MQKKLAFTGHRPESLPFGENENDPRCIRLKAMLLTEIMYRAKAGYDTFYTGCARGMDIVFGRQVLLVKATSYPHIRLIGVVPHEGQADHWSETWRDRYFRLLEQADGVVMRTQGESSRLCECLHKGTLLPHRAESVCGWGFLGELRGIVLFGQCFIVSKPRRGRPKSMSAPGRFARSFDFTPFAGSTRCF